MINISRSPSLSLTQIVLPGTIFSLGRPGGRVQLFIYFVYQNRFGAKTNPWPTGWQMSVLGIRLLLFLKTLIWLANFIQTHCKQPTPTGTNVEGWEATPSSYHQHLTCILDVLGQLLDLGGMPGPTLWHRCHPAVFQCCFYWMLTSAINGRWMPRAATIASPLYTTLPPPPPTRKYIVTFTRRRLEWFQSSLNYLH